MLAATAYVGDPNQVKERYLRLAPCNKKKTVVEYIWIDGSGVNLRSKAKTVARPPKTPADLPKWNFDGSSCGQAEAGDSEVMLIPVVLYRDPFRQGQNRMVFCEAVKNGVPAVGNNRSWCENVMRLAKNAHPWFGLEQEYTLFTAKGRPLGWPEESDPPPQGPYYCGVGLDRAYGRDLAECHYRACLFSGITVCGTNSEVMPGQQEFQVGPCEGVEAADDLWMARYVLHRTAEDFGFLVSLDPKPIRGDWNGAGCHTNFSTQAMRGAKGMEAITAGIKLLEAKHEEHIKVYDPLQGMDNRRRLTGGHETAAIDEFTWGIGDRAASVRVGNDVAAEGRGYMEDRRPSSNCDPYLVTGKIVQTVCLKEDEYVVRTTEASDDRSRLAVQGKEDMKKDKETSKNGKNATKYSPGKGRT